MERRATIQQFSSRRAFALSRRFASPPSIPLLAISQGLNVYKSLLSSAILAASFGLPVHAQIFNDSNSIASTQKLETMVVVASRTEMPARQLGTSVAVLNEAELKILGFQSLVDALRTMPSVSVANTGGMGKASSVSVRGEAGFRTLVRVDGVEITDPTGTQASSQVHHLLSAGVTRVELLRGPQGMMYGADAGGVLNITTDRVTEGLEGGLSTETGRYDSQQHSGYVSGGNDRGDFYVSAARADTDGFNARMDDPSGDPDGYENNTLHGRAGWNLPANLRLQAVARDTDSESEFDRCGFPYIDNCVERFDQSNLRVSLTHDTERSDSTLAYSKTNVERTNYAAGNPAYYTRGEIAKWELNGSAQLSDAHGLVYGLEQRHDQVMELERDQSGVYVEYQGKYARQFYLTAGARQDDNEDFGSNTSYRLSVAYLLPQLTTGTVKFKTSLGTGFRAPSLFEIDYTRRQNNPALGSLAQEESVGFDLGVEYYGDSGLHLEAVIFEQRIEDEIYFDLVAYSGYLQGAQESESRGLELIAELPLTDQLVIDSNYSYVDTEGDDGNARSRQPKHLANIGLRFAPIDTLTLALNWRTSRDRHEGSVELDDYQVLNASARYQALEGVVVYVRGENILDEDYIEVPKYNTAGAAGYAGVELSF